MRLLICCLLALASLTVTAQTAQLYQTTELQQALAKGTRTLQGVPGPNYWQNKSSYNINATLQPATRLLLGTETIQYTNNSADTLQQLVLRLYPNLFLKGTTRDRPVEQEDVTEGVRITQLTVNGTALPQDKQLLRGTNLYLTPQQPVMPHSTVSLTVAWNYNIPAKTHIREGTYNDSSFFVGYWYPQMAVYDDLYGWDNINYNGTTEFYNDFSDFEYAITVPRNYFVWATGTFVNPEEVLAQPYLGRYQQATTSDSVVRIIRPQDLQGKDSTTRNDAASTVWRYRQLGTPDVAFTCSNKYLWDAASVPVEPGRRVTVGAVYNPNSKDFYHVAEFARVSVDYFSHQLPGVPYPFPSETVFNGSGGMEFPGMVNDGSFPTTELAAEVTAHEIAHTYFPFYMGINERRFSWMDEGFAQFLPNGCTFKNPETGASFQVQRDNGRYTSLLAGSFGDVPLMVNTFLLAPSNRAVVMENYFKPSTAYTVLQDLLGQEEFKRVLNSYMATWHGKHPCPYDFFTSFDAAAKQDLSWLWKPWFFEFGVADLSLTSVVVKGKSLKLKVVRKGALPVPIHLVVTLADGSQQVVHQTARVWAAGAQSYALSQSFKAAVVKVQLGDYWIPDAHPADNSWPLTTELAGKKN